MQHPSLARLFAARDPSARREIIREDPSIIVARDSLGETAFLYSIIENEIGTAAALADAGADINVQDDYGETPLSQAVQLGYGEVVSWLIARKADLDAGRPPPIHRAAETRRLTLARELLDAGARTDVENNVGDPILHVAVERDFDELVELLLERGSDIHAKTQHGQSVLHIAGCYASEQLCKRLLAAGATASAVNQDGDRPFDVAFAFGREVIGHMLREAAEREEH